MFRGLLHSALFFLAILTILTTEAAVGICSLPPSPALAPPRPVIDHYFAGSVAGSLPFIENLADPEVHAWMHAAQDDYTRRVLASIPGRAKLFAHIKLLDESEPAEILADNQPSR